MMPIVDRNSPYDLEKSPHNHVQGQRRPDSRMEFTPCPVFHQPQQPRLPQDFFVQQHHQQQHDYQYQTVQYCLTTQQYNLVQQDTPVQQHHQQQQHHPHVAVYQQQQQQPSPLALSGATTVGQQNNVDSPGQSSVDSGFCAAAPSASLQTPAYYASSDVVLGASSLEGTEGGGGLSKQHRNSQHSQSANNPQGEKQQQQEQQEDDLDRLLELAVSSENSTAIR